MRRAATLKPVWRTLLTALLIVAAGNLFAHPDNSTDKSANQVILDYLKGVETKDLKGVLNCFTNDSVVYFSSGFIRKGEKELRESFSSAFRELDDFKTNWRSNEIRQAGNLTVVVGNLRWSAKLTSSGERINRNARGTFVLLKKNGAWKIWHEHASILRERRR